MTSMAGDDAGWDTVRKSTGKAWPHVGAQQQAAVEAKYFEEGATVEFDRLPGPPAVARLFRAGTGTQRTLIIMARVTSVARSAGRPLNQSEIDALAEQGARAAGRVAWVLPLAVAGAAVLTCVDRKRFRFPFYTPPKHGWFDPRAFPTRRNPLVRGRNAGAVWHGVRFAAYLPLTWFGTGLFMASMIRTRFLADMADPRLEGLRADIQQHQIAQGQRPRPPGMPHPAKPEIAEAWPEQGKTEEVPPSSSSPPAAQAWPAAPPASSAARQPSGGAPWPSQRSSAKEPPTPFDDTDLFDDDDDDASPVPASVRRAERRQAAQQAQQQQQQELQQQARQSQTAGSSWSRVRQQAGVSNSSPPATAATGDDAPPRGRTSAWSRVRQATTNDGPAGGEAYPYGESGDDGATSKSQAQKQFDDMLEAERQGGSGSGRGGKRGW